MLSKKVQAKLPRCRATERSTLLRMEEDPVSILTSSMAAHKETIKKTAYKFGSGKMKPEVEEYSGACHKHFRTHAQAEAFIEDWKISFAGVCGRVIKEGLDRGLRPTDMKLDLRGILGAPFASGESEDIVKDMKEKLILKDK